MHYVHEATQNCHLISWDYVLHENQAKKARMKEDTESSYPQHSFMYPFKMMSIFIKYSRHALE